MLLSSPEGFRRFEKSNNVTRSFLPPWDEPKKHQKTLPTLRQSNMAMVLHTIFASLTKDMTWSSLYIENIHITNIEDWIDMKILYHTIVMFCYVKFLEAYSLCPLLFNGTWTYLNHLIGVRLKAQINGPLRFSIQLTPRTLGDCSWSSWNLQHMCQRSFEEFLDANGCCRISAQWPRMRDKNDLIHPDYAGPNPLQ